MDETNQPKSSEDKPREHDGRFARFGRKHPAWTIAGLAAAGLIGGVEMAAGVLLGAGVIALLRARPSAPEPEAPARSHDLQDLKDRARAIVKAAKGELVPTRSAP
jgi:hypothetical protein